MKLPFLLSLAAGCFLPILASAQLPPKTTELKDSVTDLIRSAMQKYQKADLAGTSADLDAARKLVDARRGDLAANLLPNVNGWTSTKAEKQESGLLGASSAWRRTYENKEKNVKAEIVLDSPLIQSLTPLLTNPAVAQGAGFDVRRVEGRDALVKTTGDKCELNVWIGSGMLFKLSTTGMKENEVVLFAKNFDFKEMEKLKKETKDGKEK